MRPNISLGDSLAGMHAALGVLLGLIARNKVKNQSRTGQVVDVSIYESVLNMMEGIIPEYDRFQQVRQRKKRVRVNILLALCSIRFDNLQARL